MPPLRTTDGQTSSPLVGFVYPGANLQAESDSAKLARTSGYRSTTQCPICAFLFQQPDAVHAHAAISRLTHVVDGEQTDLYHGERLPSPPLRPTVSAMTSQAMQLAALVDAEIDGDPGERNRMATAGISSAVRWHPGFAAMRACRSRRPLLPAQHHREGLRLMLIMPAAARAVDGFPSWCRRSTIWGLSVGIRVCERVAHCQFRWRRLLRYAKLGGGCGNRVARAAIASTVKKNNSPPAALRALASARLRRQLARSRRCRLRRAVAAGRTASASRRWASDGGRLPTSTMWR